MTMQELAKEAIKTSYAALYHNTERGLRWDSPEQQANVIKLACTLIEWSNGKPDSQIVATKTEEVK